MHRFIKKAFTLTPRQFAIKVVTKAKIFIQNRVARKQDQQNCTYCRETPFALNLHHMIKALPNGAQFFPTEQIAVLSKFFIEHRFDLLGSGWVRVYHDMKCRGLEGYLYNMGKPIQVAADGKWLEGRINSSNLSESRKIWALVDSDYKPIDWHVDFKSGYRWSEQTWYKDIKFGHKLGVDVKVPWELARMQHLPMLAWSYALSKHEEVGFQAASVYAREFRNQILDFIATNPPRYGVNWFCTMDVAIRVVNWLVAYDMFNSFGNEFDGDFERALASSVYEHGKHCLENLEYSQESRNNHYLSNIAGLLFVAAYLPETKEINCWLAFAIKELISEMAFQFNPDGSNFEASTSYHRLSTEIMIYAVILCLLLPSQRLQTLKSYDHQKCIFVPSLHPYEKLEFNFDSPAIFPDWFFARLEKAIEFTKDITKPNDEIPQFGDNDSGRFLKVWPKYRMMKTQEAILKYRNLSGYDELALDAIYPDEDFLDHSHLMGVAGVVFKREDLQSVAQMTPETSMIKVTLGERKIKSYRVLDINDQTLAEKKCVVGNGKGLEIWYAELRKELGEPVFTKFCVQSDGASLIKDMHIFAYPDFGIYIYKSPHCYLAVRCGGIVLRGTCGHAHNDQLGIELSIDGKDLIRDPGTYLYTPLPERRNQFRSTLAHFVPQWRGQEQNTLPCGREGLFFLQGRKTGACLYFAIDGFVGRHDAYEHSVYRVIHIGEDIVSIWDFGADRSYQYANHYSNGYGRWV